VGQESDRAANLLHDGHEVRWRDRLKLSDHRQLAAALGGQQQYLTALDVPAPVSRSRRLTTTAMAARRSHDGKNVSSLVSGDHRAPRHDHEQSSGPGACLARDKGNLIIVCIPRGTGLIVIGRSPGGKAES